MERERKVVFMLALLDFLRRMHTGFYTMTWRVEATSGAKEGHDAGGGDGKSSWWTDDRRFVGPR